MQSDGIWWRPWVRDATIALVVTLACLPAGLAGVVLYLKGWTLSLVGPPLFVLALWTGYQTQRAVCARFGWDDSIGGG